MEVMQKKIALIKSLNMKNSVRTFIAVKIEPERELKTFFRELKKLFSEESIKWVDEDNLHLTLRFLGETTNEQVQMLLSSLKKIALQTGNFKIKLKGVGYFKSNRFPRVIFINATELTNLKLLAASIEEESQNTGFEPEGREFNPHLTLGRIKYLKNRDRLIQFISEWKDSEFQEVLIKEIILYQSILNEKEPVYKPLGKFELK